mmetsp:Transcript_7665/g.17906  ORF Transcript_7665/g.17906 Transcript_7665/m.17906 type:complete len:284 (-) Transcript_7665:739-1590(-)
MVLVDDGTLPSLRLGAVFFFFVNQLEENLSMDNLINAFRKIFVNRSLEYFACILGSLDVRERVNYCLLVSLHTTLAIRRLQMNYILAGEAVFALAMVAGIDGLNELDLIGVEVPVAVCEIIDVPLALRLGIHRPVHSLFCPRALTFVLHKFVGAGLDRTNVRAELAPSVLRNRYVVNMHELLEALNETSPLLYAYTDMVHSRCHFIHIHCLRYDAHVFESMTCRFLVTNKKVVKHALNLRKCVVALKSSLEKFLYHLIFLHHSIRAVKWFTDGDLNEKELVMV